MSFGEWGFVFVLNVLFAVGNGCFFVFLVEFLLFGLYFCK
jgi:hypothetical protein